MCTKRHISKDILRDILCAFEVHAQRKAFVIEDIKYSYKLLFERVTAIYSCLSQRKETNVGVLGENDIDTYASILAILFSGRTYVILHPSYPDDRNREIASLANISLLLGTGKRKPPVDSLVFVATEDLRSDATTTIHYEPNEEKNAYIIFTSGSTGQPKGVPISVKNLNRFYDAYSRLGWELTAEDRMLQMFELTFDVSVVSFLYPLTLGASIYTVGYDDVKYLKVFDILETHELTFAAVAPSLLQLFSPYFEEVNLPKLKYLVVTAEAANSGLLSSFRRCTPNASFVNLYGPTEATIYCTAYQIPPTDCKEHNGMVAIGKPFHGIEALIVDENGENLSQNATGELWITGDQVMNGYWKDAEKTSLSVVEGKNGKRYYKTGDLCRIDNDGDIIYCGRKDHQVKIQGYRIELSEIELCARKSFDVPCNVVVVPKYTDNNLCELHLIVESSNVDKHALTQHLTSKLPPYMLPKQIHCMQQFPLNNSNKIDRKKIAQSI